MVLKLAKSHISSLEFSIVSARGANAIYPEV